MRRKDVDIGNVEVQNQERSDRYDNNYRLHLGGEGVQWFRENGSQPKQNCQREVGIRDEQSEPQDLTHDSSLVVRFYKSVGQHQK